MEIKKIDLTIDWAGHSPVPVLQVVLPKAEVLLRLGQGAFQRTMIHERVEAARAGCNPFAITRLKSGWWVLGDTHFCAATAYFCRILSCLTSTR